ncbi:MAG: DUF1573 domain-containing protein [Flavipsychrobacter sp.]|nr:DUF1573 domain-containing protein [Flavipsychrobacter sp.]
MKQLLYVSLLLSLAACNQSGTGTKSTTDSGMLSTSLISNPRSANGIDSAKANRMPSMSFKDTLHNFNTIQEGEQVMHDFEFVNNGKSPLIISSATGSCGCTIAEYPRDPILAGKGGTIKVLFNSSGKFGHQEKSVTIATNTVRGIYMLYIQGDVIGTKENSPNAKPQ